MKQNTENYSYTAFLGQKLLAKGLLEDVVIKVKRKLEAQPDSPILVFSDFSGKQMDFNLQGTEKDVLNRLQIYLSPETKNSPTRPGRPKLGVVAREVSLLPRHWEWLSIQSGGASAVLRRLIDEAKKNSSGKDLIKQAQERTYTFMSCLAGDLPNYEEALRALYAKDKKKFKEQVSTWPADIKNHALNLADPVFNFKSSASRPQ